MAEPTSLKVKGDYSEHVISKEVDGQIVECVDIDALTEDQWQKFCRATGTEPFRRLNVNV